MKYTHLLIIVLALGAVATGCKKNNATEAGSSASDTNSSLLSVTQQIENAREIATNAWQKTVAATTNAWEASKESLLSLNDSTYDKKEALVAQASTNLAALDQKLKDLSDQAATAQEAVKADAQAKMQTLRDQRALLDQKMAALKNATAADWDALKTDFNSAYDQVKTASQDFWQWLKDKSGA